MISAPLPTASDADIKAALPASGGKFLGKRRASARLAAVQALYAAELSGRTPEAALAGIATGGAPIDPEGGEAPLDDALFHAIVRGATVHRAEGDAAVQAAIDGDRKLMRQEAIIRALLRAGAYELVYCTDTDAPLIIADYTGIAQAFYGGPEPGFVNAVLDRVARAAGRPLRDSRAPDGLAADPLPTNPLPTEPLPTEPP